MERVSFALRGIVALWGPEAMTSVWDGDGSGGTIGLSDVFSDHEAAISATVAEKWSVGRESDIGVCAGRIRA